MSGKMKKRRCLMAVLIGMTLLILSGPAESATRVKDVAFVQGVRGNQLVGYGLVAGLDGTGDGRRVPFTSEMLANMVNQFGIKFETRQLRVENVAAVMITAELPAYAKEGSRLDVVVSAIGDAESLRGGTLLLTPLRGADNETYAVAQGAVSIGGFETRARRGGQEKHLTVGMVTGGGFVEKEVPSTILSKEGHLTLCLKRTDFTTAARIADVINLRFHQTCAEAIDGGTVKVEIPQKYMDDRITFISEMELTPVEPDVVAKVIINERTGTVVVGRDAIIEPVAVSHGDIRITIGEPSPEEFVEIEAMEGHVAKISGANVGEVAAALNTLGVVPQDMIAIFQAIERAGALHARLELM